MENKKIKNATTTVYDSITFKSKMEVICYRLLKEQGFNPQYEPVTFPICSGFYPLVPFYCRNKKTGEFEINKTKIIDIKYTPDFVFTTARNTTVYVEIKGMENDCYYLKKKLFRKYLETLPGVNVYAEIKSKRELLEFIEILKTNY
jgi:predicted nuclease of restriction endonuclease-like RecB superfamily